MSIAISDDHRALSETASDFLTKREARGAAVYFSYPSFSRTLFEKNRRAYDDVVTQLERGLKCPVVTRPEATLYGDDQFFETEYHLRKEARDDRTEKLVDGLSEAIRKKTGGPP